MLPDFFDDQITQELSLKNFGMNGLGDRTFARAQLFRQMLGGLRHPDRRLYHLAQPLHRRKIALPESVRFPRKQLEHSQNLIIIYNRHDQDRGNPHLLAHLAIHASVPLGVITAHQLAGAHAFAGKPKLGGKQRAQLRRIGPRTGPA